MPLVKCPIPVTGVHGRYAAALYSAAVKSKSLEKVETEIKDIQNEFLKDPGFKNFIVDPFVNKREKKKAIVQVLQKLNAMDITQRFFGIVLNLLPALFVLS
ncbi:unnamed protein product [Soboliphyme baturini]|uniref:Oligomycin sensitivity conferral protein n=1 Tax=Soboliphyme baturini TaxID=241478 RepID=A0A183JA16_9BILA|nr:unnamed protein product [Soboliphyme baturini]